MPRSRRGQDRKSEALRLHTLREVLGLSQRELAIEFNVAYGAVASWESQKRAIPGPALRLLELYEQELGLEAPAGGMLQLRTSLAARHLALTKTAGNVVVRAMAGLLERLLASDAHANTVSARAHAAIARNVVDNLGELKGLAMKAGQTLAYVDFLLPEATRLELTTLLTSSRPMASSVVAQVFLEEFGQLPRELFAEWSGAPFAAASIGQVHRARLRSGEEVAVKVQYPRIVEALESDLRSAALLDRLGEHIFRGQERGAFLAELRERFGEECDYRIEAGNQEEFRRRWLGRPGVRIPRVYRELSTRRVLVTELIQGEGFESFLGHASPADRDRAGALLFRFAFESVFRQRAFHADPHPGNYLFADGQLILLDFGCVKRLSEPQVEWWKAYFRAYLERDLSAARELTIAMHIVPEPGAYDFDYHHRTALAELQFCLFEDPFRFTPEFLQGVVRAKYLDNPGRFHSNVPRDWVFLNRLLLGLFAVLARLQAEGAFRGVLLDLLYEPGMPRPPAYSSSKALVSQR